MKLKFDLEDLKKEKEVNLEERLKFIDFWVDYIKENKDWSKQQKDFVDSLLKDLR